MTYQNIYSEREFPSNRNCLKVHVTKKIDLKLAFLLFPPKDPFSLYLQHARSHSPLPDQISDGNFLVDQIASTGMFIASVEQVDKSHSYTKTNIKGLQAHFPHVPLAQTQRRIKIFSCCASLLLRTLYKLWTPNSGISYPMTYGKLISYPF